MLDMNLEYEQQKQVPAEKKMETRFDYTLHNSINCAVTQHSLDHFHPNRVPLQLENFYSLKNERKAK